MTFCLLASVLAWPEGAPSWLATTWLIRAAYQHAGLVVLRAMFDADVHPANQLPPAAAPCAGCRKALPGPLRNELTG